MLWAGEVEGGAVGGGVAQFRKRQTYSHKGAEESANGENEGQRLGCVPLNSKKTCFHTIKRTEW